MPVPNFRPYCLTSRWHKRERFRRRLCFAGIFYLRRSASSTPVCVRYFTSLLQNKSILIYRMLQCYDTNMIAEIDCKQSVIIVFIALLFQVLFEL